MPLLPPSNYPMFSACGKLLTPIKKTSQDDLKVTQTQNNEKMREAILIEIEKNRQTKEKLEKALVELNDKKDMEQLDKLEIFFSKVT